MIRATLVILISLIGFSAFSQSIQAESNTLAGTKNQLPFWFWANQQGRYERSTNFIQHFALNGDYSYETTKSDFNFSLLSKLDFLLGENTNDIRFTELAGELNWKSLQLKAGAFAEEQKYYGLSSTNGNLANSGNAKPHPAIRIGLNKYVSLTNWLSVYGFYEEGILNDSRYVSDIHLHHKAFYFQIGNPGNLTFTGGLEHYVMWGGTHPDYGTLPGWSAYFDYVLGRNGGNDALPTDQINVLGNQYGTYQLELKKESENYTYTFYVSHPFEDRSGLELENYKDNLFGIFLASKKPKALLEGLVLEYFNTKNQSGAYHLVAQNDGTNSGRGRDNYFNHGIYKSGATYHQFAMVSPFFGPVVLTANSSMGVESTRFSGMHFGANGKINERVSWGSKLSYTKHFGQYDNQGNSTYLPARKLLASRIDIRWNSPKLPLSLGTSFAADYGSLFDNGTNKTRLGIQCSISWQIKR